jgi:hypothetical protein
VATVTLDADWHEPTESSFNERDADVLTLISEEDLTLFTFDGLKRRMSIHPETLSRILSRLEQEGIVEKGHGGYKVTSKINELLRAHPICSDESRVPLLQTFLPSDTSVPNLTAHLRGRWFGLLRWLGLSEGNTGAEVTLKWITEDGGIQVDANVSERALTIEAKFLHDKDLNMALKASYQLMAYIGKLCSGSRSIRRVAYVGDFDTHPTPA